MSASPQPVGDDSFPELERYQIHSRFEIASTLRELAERRIPVTVYSAPSGDFLVSLILGINPEFEELIFDGGGDPAVNRRMLQSLRLTFVALLHKVRLQFNASRAEVTIHEGKPAFRVRLPDSLIRLQRREFYRVTPLVTRPLHCRVPGATGEVDLRVLDLGGGGLALLLPATGPALEPGMLLQSCSIELPAVGRLSFASVVRSVIPLDASAGGPPWRCGLQFVNLPGPMVTLLQRHIIQFERERLTRA